MPGYVLCTSACLTCKRLFSYNPHHVPSLRVKGEREPICPSCMESINMKRTEKGLDPFPIHPEAYEPLPEELL